MIHALLKFHLPTKEDYEIFKKREFIILLHAAREKKALGWLKEDRRTYLQGMKRMAWELQKYRQRVKCKNCGKPVDPTSEEVLCDACIDREQDEKK